MQYFEGLREEERKNLLNFINEKMTTDQDGFDQDGFDYAMTVCSDAIEEYVEYRIAERMENKK